MLPPGLAGPEPVPLKLFLPKLSSGSGRPGEVLGIDRDGLHIACGQGAVAIPEAQLPGRKRLRCAELASGRALAVGDQLVAPVDPPPA